MLSVHSGQTDEFVNSGIGRDLGPPGQMISYKLGWFVCQVAAERSGRERIAVLQTRLVSIRAMQNSTPSRRRDWA